LPAIDAAAARMLGLLDGDAPLRLGDEDRSSDDENKRGRQEQDFSRPNLSFAGGADGHVALIDELADGHGHAGDNAGEDDQADAVAQAVFVDLLAEPHEEYAAGGEGDESREPEGERTG